MMNEPSALDQASAKTSAPSVMPSKTVPLLVA